MKKLFFLITLTTIGVSAFSQNEKLKFSPNWKKGETKTLTTTILKPNDENGMDTTVSEMKLKVTDDSKSAYTIEVIQENTLMASMGPVQQLIGDDLSGFETMKCIFKIEKEGGKASLVNWKEIQGIMTLTTQQLIDKITEKLPDLGPQLEMAFNPLLAQYATQEGVEASTLPQISTILLPYQFEFSKTDTVLSETSSNMGGMMPMDLTTKTKMWLSDVNPTSCKISSTSKMDLGALKEMLSSMGQGEDMEGALSELNMDMDTKREITYDRNSTWITKIVSTTDIKSPVDGSKQMGITTTVIQ